MKLFREDMGAEIRDAIQTTRHEQPQTHGRNHPRNRNYAYDYYSDEDAKVPCEMERNATFPATKLPAFTGKENGLSGITDFLMLQD